MMQTQELSFTGRFPVPRLTEDWELDLDVTLPVFDHVTMHCAAAMHRELMEMQDALDAISQCVIY